MNGCYVCVCGRRRLATAAQSSVFNWRPGSKSGRWPSLFVKVELPLVHLPLERYPVSFLRDPALHPVDRGAVRGRMPWCGAPPLPCLSAARLAARSARGRRRVRHVSPQPCSLTLLPRSRSCPSGLSGARPPGRSSPPRLHSLPIYILSIDIIVCLTLVSGIEESHESRYDSI